MMRAHLYIVTLAFCALTTNAWAASISLRQADGESQFTAELGQVVNMEIFIDAGVEELTGYSLFLSYDSSVFSLVPAEFDEAGQPLPFAATGYLGGIVLVNAVEEIAAILALNSSNRLGQPQAIDHN